MQILNQLKIGNTVYDLAARYDSNSDDIKDTYLRKDEMPLIELAVTGAENVNATITEENVFEVTDRTGVTKTLDLNVSDGTPAGFGEIAATVDNSIGTPSVTVTTSGTNEAKNFTFEFTGLKGEKGDKGEVGMQGNSGVTDASNKTLVNDAITGGETDFLSAEVGKLGILTYDCSKGGSITHATLQDAINSVPTTFQKVGLTITYKSGDTIHRYTLNANAWSADPVNWFSVEDKLSDLERIKMDRTSIAQESGDAENKVMSQKATTTAIADEVARAKAAEQAIIFDVSSHNNGAVFESLSALLNSSNLNTLIPTSVRCGGMSIRFIQGSEHSSDNKYVQYRLMATSFSTSRSDWQGVDDEPTAGSDNIVKSGGVANKLTELEEDVEVTAEKNTTPPVVEGLAVKNKNLVKIDATKKTFYVQGKEGQSITIYFVDTTDTVSFYFGFADEMPVEGLPITDYKTSSPSDTLRNLVFPKDCYLLVSCSTTNSCYYIKEKTSGIGFDVYNLKHTINESKENAEFSVEGKGIWYEDDSRYKGGSDIIASSNKATSFIKLGNAKSIVFKLIQFERSTFAAVAYYDKDKNYLGGLKGYDGNTEVTISALEFPSDSFYVRFSSAWVEGLYAIVYYEGNAIDGLKNDIKDINTALANHDNEFKYWAACGDSITHANHKCMTPLAGDDSYNPIDDYQGRGYNAYQSGNYPNYAYLYCKKHHIKWANYGFGGTIIGSYVPIGETLLYPFVEDRITQFKEGINWNYISLFFGWNDRVHGVQYYREKWLYDNYGVAIKYTTESSKYGTSGYCTESQRIACDNATEVIDGVSYTGYNLFFMKFLGNIKDTTKYTYYGAYNYAVDYLMRKFPKAKIMLITPYIGDVNRMYYQKMRQAIIDVAEKFGIIYFDLGSLPYWYFTNMNNTPFANPDREDGMWYKDSWIPEEPELRLCNPTIEGFHQHLYCYDSVHPTNLGYEMIAEPIGNKLING